jgi:ubiquinone/menaquinone biosynthesis C-methylase UbiE
MLNRANRTAVAGAVAAVDLAPGDTAADLGFGGGLGLDLLLDAVGPNGHVVGVDVSQTVIDRAARRHRHQVANDRLSLHLASMTQLPLDDEALDGATLSTPSTSSRSWTERSPSSVGSPNARAGS